VLLESGEHAFSTITGTWTVPDAYPPASDWTGTAWSDGYWNALHWIGIDGWSGTGANNVMQVGTGTNVSVQNGNVTVSCYAWLEWYYSVTNNGFATINKFTVSPGDLIEATVCGVPGTDDPGTALIANVTRHEYMNQAINPPSTTVSLEGTNAEWIVEREGLSSGLATLADYGAMFFTDCRAGWSIDPSSELDLSGATFINMTDGATTVSTALQVSDSVLECYYGTVQP
jgi:Peptidase A4 family